jgi:dihydrodipicolinate synthase/N-acetylneuraminate lyase
MKYPSSVTEQRQQLLARFFPNGVPTLWCPLITHYDVEGAIDRKRLAAHLDHISPFVKGILVPGSTGDGWEMNESEIRQVVDCALTEAARLNLRVLIGVLKTDGADVLRTVREMAEWLKLRTGESDVHGALEKSHTCGFTVCPPRGKELTQERIGQDLKSVLETSLPISLYQLPQITQNEMSPELVARLAAHFGNFFLFKDTSGADRVAFSGENLGGVFVVRGAEGNYARWLKAARGPYDGFLLSTANCLAHELHSMIEDLKARHFDAASKRATRLTALVDDVFRIVNGLPHGNAFANANKAMDHFFAFGPKASEVTPPRLHSGSRLPVEVIRATGDALARHGLMQKKGYVE